MEYKLMPIEVPKDNPFINDALSRKPSVEALTTLIDQLDGPFVLAIDSPGGTGKTTFLEMWKSHLELQDYVCIYFNSWEVDFSTDPLIAFLGEFNKVASEFGTGNKEFNASFKQAKRIATLLAKRAIPVAGKIATAGLFDIDKFTENAISDVTVHALD